MKLTPEQKDAAYRRGWNDRERGIWALNVLPIDERYDYSCGWRARSDAMRHGDRP